MTTICRKIYIPWGNQVIAVELYPETPDHFTDRTGIPLDQKVPFVSEVVDYGLGENIEKKVGPSIREHYLMATLTDIVSTHAIFISPSDIADQCKHSNIPTNFQDGYSLGIEKNMVDYMTSYRKESLLGFIEVPNEKEHKLLYNFNQLITACAVSSIGKLYVPVFVFDGRINQGGEFFGFDSEDCQKIVQLTTDKPWIVYYAGTDNSSYGQRFQTQEEALAFANNGYKAGYSNQLQYFNS